MAKNAKIFEHLEIVAPILPAPIYWFDLNSILMGINEHSLEAIGGKTYDDIIGKSVYELGYPYEMADSIVKHNQKVIKTGKTLVQEDAIKNMKTGKIRYFIATRSPLRDDKGKIIGVIGTSIEITGSKEAEKHRLENERLKLENEKHEALAQARESGMELADTMYRDQQSALVKYLRAQAGNHEPVVEEKIDLTLLEEQTLFTVFNKRNAKSAAEFLRKVLGSDANQDSVNAMLNKHLYPKFNVNSQDKLFEKAFLLKMMPLFFPTREKPRKSRKKSVA